MDFFIIFFVVIVLLLIIYWYGICVFLVLSWLNVFGLKFLLFVGNLFEVCKYGSVYLMMLEYVWKYGKVFVVFFGMKLFLVVVDFEMLKMIMVKEFFVFYNCMFLIFLLFMNLVVFFVCDEMWKWICNILMFLFSVWKMKLMVLLIEELCDVLMKKLEEIVDIGKLLLCKI